MAANTTVATNATPNPEFIIMSPDSPIPNMYADKIRWEPIEGFPDYVVKLVIPGDQNAVLDQWGRHPNDTNYGKDPALQVERHEAVQESLRMTAADFWIGSDDDFEYDTEEEPNSPEKPFKSKIEPMVNDFMLKNLDEDKCRQDERERKALIHGLRCRIEELENRQMPAELEAVNALREQVNKEPSPELIHKQIKATKQYKDSKAELENCKKELVWANFTRDDKHKLSDSMLKTFDWSIVAEDVGKPVEWCKSCALYMAKRFEKRRLFFEMKKKLGRNLSRREQRNIRKLERRLTHPRTDRERFEVDHLRPGPFFKH